MKPLTLGDLRESLPALEELKPMLDLLLAHSRTDPTQRWARSAEVGTIEERVIDPSGLDEQAAALANATREHLTEIYGHVAGAVTAMAEGDAASAARSLLEAARIEEERDRAGRAAAYAESAHRLSRQAGSASLSSLAARRWGRALLASGRLEEALRRYRDSFEVASAEDDAAGAAEAAIGAGNVLERLGAWSDAATWYHRAMDLADRGAVDDARRWHARLNLHIVLRSAGRVDESTAWLEEARRIASESGDESALTPLSNAAGQLKMREGAYRDAEQDFQAALDGADGSRARATVLLNLGECLLAQGRTLEAAEQARKAEEVAVRAGLTSSLPETYRLLGRIAHAEGNPEAFVLFERALQVVRDHHLPRLEAATTLQAYSWMERARGEHESADQLIAQAQELLNELGVSGFRHPWVESYEQPADDAAMEGL